ncbi:MAG TPA: MgtC/SapB family protein [Candidatus Cybelea sp.]|jgi:putative Mg2+ transporter-C (MgtC) family protein|nr:MgtC/SapB family protein [Candidatus Cybelea sp.]
MKATDITTFDFVVRLAAAAAFGAVIGFERQWRQRSAGLHTTSLVAIGAALFALLDTVLAAGDTTRIIAGVVTGVGFIAGGVIFRSGANVSGLNTAATIWATAAVGALAGFGLWAEAGAGAAAVVLFNLFLQPVADAIDVRAKRGEYAETLYRISIVCVPDSQTAVSAEIVKAIGARELSLQSLTRRKAQEGRIALDAEIFSPKTQTERIEALSTRLLALTGVASADWQSAPPPL